MLFGVTKDEMPCNAVAKETDNGTWYVQCHKHGFIDSGLEFQVAASIVFNHNVE